MHRMWRTSCWFLVLGLEMALWGCAITRTPLMIDDHFAKMPPDLLTFLPVVDIRKDKAASKINIDKDLKTSLVKQLAWKGFSILTPGGWTHGAQPVPEALAEMDVSELATLGPADSHYLFMVFFEDLATSYIGVAKTSKVAISAALIDKPGRRYLWKDKCVETTSFIGLTSGLLPTQMNVLSVCFGKMLAGFPDRCHRCRRREPVPLEVVSEPAGATVTVNGIRQGVTPTTTGLEVATVWVGLGNAPGGRAHSGEIFTVTVQPPPTAEPQLTTQTKYIAPALTGASLFFDLSVAPFRPELSVDSTKGSGSN